MWCRTQTKLEFVYFIGAVREKIKPYFGILARGYDPTSDTCCTVMKVDKSLQVYSFKDIDLALC